MAPKNAGKKGGGCVSEAVLSRVLRVDHSVYDAVREYWNVHIHDLAIARSPIGTPGFFQELDEYRFDKLRYLPNLVDFSAYAGKELLEIGCGVGIDLVRFALGKAIVTGVDLSPKSIQLAKQNFQNLRLPGALDVMNGEVLEFPDNHFDVVYGHGVLQYTPDPQQMVDECFRVLRPGGTAIFMVYNKYSWLSAMRKFTKVELEHEDAPVFRMFSIPEFKRMLSRLSRVRIVPERFPVRTRLHQGLKAKMYNEGFVRLFNMLPRSFVRPLGWHLMAFGTKE